MRKYIFIAIAGSLGTILRYVIRNIHISNYKEIIPINTLLINISGSFLLAFILTVALEIWTFDTDIRLGIATGFIGSYTTFSTMCKETVELMRRGYYYSAISYICFSAMLGLAAAYFGVILAREVISKLVNKNNSYNLEDEDTPEHEQLRREIR